MTMKKARLTQREKAERAKIKKKLQADGLLPPDKPRLNRRRFAAEVVSEFQAMDGLTADFYLRESLWCMVSADMREVTPEQVGVLKLMKIAVETQRFMEKLKAEGRTKYNIKEYYDEVVWPVERM